MIYLHELIKPHDTPDRDALALLGHLHFTLNFLRRLTPFPWVISRGFSTAEEQLEIYKAKGQQPKMGSCHLIGAAVDVYDPDLNLKKWILENLEIVETLNLFMEDFDSTPTWVHLQILPYGSWQPGKSHFFQP